MEFFKGMPVTMVAAGGYHTMAVTDDHELYCWGASTYGECGYGDFNNITTPREAKVPKESSDEHTVIRAIAAGGHHSMVLSNQGYMYTFGAVANGQLGLKVTKNQCTP